MYVSMELRRENVIPKAVKAEKKHPFIVLQKVTTYLYTPNSYHDILGGKHPKLHNTVNKTQLSNNVFLSWYY